MIFNFHWLLIFIAHRWESVKLNNIDFHWLSILLIVKVHRSKITAAAWFHLISTILIQPVSKIQAFLYMYVSFIVSSTTRKIDRIFKIEVTCRENFHFSDNQQKQCFHMIINLKLIGQYKSMPINSYTYRLQGFWSSWFIDCWGSAVIISEIDWHQ